MQKIHGLRRATPRPLRSLVIEQLRAEVADLRASLASEVRTRRLVVVDEHDVERIYTEQREFAVVLNVTWPTAGGHASVASLYADDGAAGISVTCAETIVADLCGIVGEDLNAITASGLVSFHSHEWSDDRQTVDVVGTLDTSGLRTRAGGAASSSEVVLVLESGVRRVWPDQFTAGTARRDVGQQVEGSHVVAVLDPLTGEAL